MTSTSLRDSQPESGTKRQPWLKLAALLLVVAALGLPINDLFRYALLVVATVLIVVGGVTVRRKPWLGAAAAVALCVLGQFWLAAPRIEEGHNVFIVDGPGGALEAGLPSQAFRLMAAEFDAKYPPERRCDPRADGCWRGQGFPDRPFAFSADGIYQQPAYSRRVSGIDFSDPVWLRLGFINELRYNWNSTVSDLDRASRDRRTFALLHRWRLEMPWFVMYRFPADFVGSELCWRGEVLWEGMAEHFEPISHASMQCRTLAPDDVGRRIFGVAIKQDLAMRLRPGVKIRLHQLVEPALALIGSAAVVALLVFGSLNTGSLKTASLRIWRRAALPFALIAVTLAVAFLNDASFIGGVRPFDSGDDGLVYDGYARMMLRHLLAGDIAGALEGGEKVFYFTPGMRYLRAVEHLIFGETYLGYLSLVLLLPFLVFALFRRFLPARWALASVVIFAAIPVGVLFGSSLVQYVKWAARGFADPAAYAFFLAGLVLLVGRRDAGPRDRLRARRSPPASCSRLRCSCGRISRRPPAFCSPAPGSRRSGSASIGASPGCASDSCRCWAWRCTIGSMAACLCCSPRPPRIPVRWSTPPSAYLAALLELAHFEFAGDQIARVMRQLGGWLAGPSESVLMAPLHAAAIVVLVRVALWRRRRSRGCG